MIVREGLLTIMPEKVLVGFCVRVADDRRSWDVEHLFSDESEGEPLTYPGNAEGTEELLDYLRMLTAGRIKRRQ
jgi:hypothetical protein